MRLEMIPVGIACRLILWLAELFARIGSGDFSQKLRRTIMHVLNWGAPSRIRGSFPHIDASLIFGFNHPTLGEIIRLLAILEHEYPDKKFLFPVNICWYEVIAPVATRMEALGLYIVPTITPSTREKMAKILDEERMQLVDRITNEFNFDYLEACSKFVNEKEIVVIAPSATRQETVFRSLDQSQGAEKIEPATMTLIAMSLQRAKCTNYLFVPIAIVPPKHRNRMLNLFRIYRVAPCDWITDDSIKKLCREKNKANQRVFEHFFLNEIAKELVLMDAANLVYPSQ